MSRTEVVLTSGKRIPTEGPGTVSNNSLSYSKVTARKMAQNNFPIKVSIPRVWNSFLPSSSVRSRSGGELGAPSPMRVKPRTWIS